MKVIYDRDRGDLYRINRGGARYSLARYCRAADRDCRNWGAASWRSRSLGFRPIIRIRIKGLE